MHQNKKKTIRTDSLKPSKFVGILQRSQSKLERAPIRHYAGATNKRS